MVLRCKYEYTRLFGSPSHIWSAIGAKSGIHLWIRDSGEKANPDSRFYGGIEIHYRQPPDYMRDDPPSHDECWLLKCPCWHDGSSLQASEIYIPMWLANPHDHDGMFEIISRRLSKQEESSRNEQLSNAIDRRDYANQGACSR